MPYQEVMNIPLVILLLVSSSYVSGNLNLYLTKKEVKGLLGLEQSELFYIREGVINTYALRFSVKVPANISDLHFTWNALSKRPMPYVASVDYSNKEAMGLPRLNISAKGLVPHTPTTFRLTLPCSGREDAEVLVLLQLNITAKSNDNITSVTFRRSKICKKKVSSESNDSVYLIAQAAPSPLGSLYIAMGCAATATILVITVTAVLYLRIRRARNTSTSTSNRFYTSPSYFDNGKSNASLRSNSYATIASCKHLSTETKTVLLDNKNSLSYNFGISCMGPEEGEDRGITKYDANLIGSESYGPSRILGDFKTNHSVGGSTLGLIGRSYFSEKSAESTNNSMVNAARTSRINTSNSVAGIRTGGTSSELLSSPFKFPIASSKSTSEAQNDSLHYASSPLNRRAASPQSEVYSQPYYSPAHSWHPKSSGKLPNNSWSCNTLRQQRDKRRKTNKELLKSLEVERWRVVLGDVIHCGTFGRVHEGICKDKKSGVAHPVVVKTVSNAASSSQAEMVLKEGLLLSGLTHPHLLPAIGVCTASPHAPLLLYPQYSGSHNLKEYLLKSSSGNGGITKLLTHDAVTLAIGVCKGLMHLHHSNILHRDVATRNCMVDSELCVRLGDTALSRDLFPSDYHCLGDNENRPVKWLPLESLQHNTYSKAADIWMFGVLVWELITLAQPPYVEVDPYEMEAYLRDGYRLAQPRSCPDDLFGVMAVCWAPQADERPPLGELLNCLESFHSTLTAFI